MCLAAASYASLNQCVSIVGFARPLRQRRSARPSSSAGTQSSCDHLKGSWVKHSVRFQISRFLQHHSCRLRRKVSTISHRLVRVRGLFPLLAKTHLAASWRGGVGLGPAAMARRGLENVTLQDWLRHVGQASTDLHRAVFPDMPVKQGAICCCGLAKASTTAYNELWLAAQALSKTTHGAQDGNHINAAVQASQKVEAAMRRIQPLADPDNEDLLVESGPRDQPDVDSVQSNERRDINGDDEPRKPPSQSADPFGQSAAALLPIAILAPWASTNIMPGCSQRRSSSRCNSRGTRSSNEHAVSKGMTEVLDFI